MFDQPKSPFPMPPANVTLDRAGINLSLDRGEI